jgi:hypothetical protein
MSRGVLIFAFSNEKIDYLNHANWVADRVKKYLDLSTTIITDEKSINGREFSHDLLITDALSGGKRNFDKGRCGADGTWYNKNRFQSYNLTPYDETLVIDSDYVVNSDQLLKIFDNPHNVLCHRDVYDVSGRGGFLQYKTFGHHNFPHYWATILYFKKSPEAKQMFELMTMIKDNYGHYSKLYKFQLKPYRNDFVVSIALSILYGHRLGSVPTIPWDLPSAFSDVEVEQLDETKFQLMYEKWTGKEKKTVISKIKGTDFHCINKFALDKIVNA